MVKDDQQSRQNPRPAPRGVAFQVAAVALALGSLSGMGFLMHRWMHTEPGAVPVTGGGPADSGAPSRLFRSWPAQNAKQPALVLLLSAQQHGYIQPCGCSPIQYGGLERRFNFMKGLQQQRGWQFVSLDLGDVAQKSGPQAKIKYRYSMEALKLLKYAAVGVGETEMALPLIDALAEYSLNNSTPRVVAANLKNVQAKFPGMVEPWEVTAVNNVKVAAVGVVCPSVAATVRDPDVAFDQPQVALPGVVKALDQQQRPDVRVLLCQGTTDEAKALAAQFPQFQVVLALSQEEEAPEAAVKVGHSIVVSVGHKGRALGLVGLYPTGNAARPFDLYYQLAPLGPEYATPVGQEAANPIMGLLERYTQEVKRDNYLARYAKTKHPIQLEPKYQGATYVGSEQCKKCHDESFKVWKGSGHAHAFNSLVNAKRPALRQFDGECVVCHVVGFHYQTGYRNENETAKLHDVGCESCHGPGSLHIKNKFDKQLHALMNPYRTPPNEKPDDKAKRMLRLGDACRKCHDLDNDVSWNIAKWEKIVHREPKE